MTYDPKRDKPPLITPDLLTYLDFLYRDQAPELSLDEKHVWYHAGQVSVVRHLRQIQKQQEDNLLRS